MGNRVIPQARAFLQNACFSISGRPYRDVLFVSEGAGWVTSWELREIGRIAGSLGLRTRRSGPLPAALPGQSMFFANKYIVLTRPRRYLSGGSRIAFPYYHGNPDSGDPSFVRCYENLKRFHGRICRIQVTHSQVRDLVLSSGIDPSKVFRIPIGINLSFFRPAEPEERRRLRQKYDVPLHAAVIGSFQKDGEGWGEGRRPKRVKGPDVFLDVVRVLKTSISDLFILLSGPARGYVKEGLEKLGVPYRHVFLKDYRKVGELYRCLDLYLVTSREEGGPKAVLESMASGVPLVTTRVGQAMDLVRHGENGWMTGVEDVEGLAHWVEKVLAHTNERSRVLENGLRTARANTYDAQRDLWRDFFRGFVDPC